MLHNYIFRLTLLPLLSTIGALGFLALLTQSISTLDLIIEQRQGLLTYLQITALALPQLFSLVLPLGVFIAVLYAMSRLKSDAELIVCSAAGMGQWQIAAPVIKLATLALVVNLALNLWVQPTAFREMREKLYEVRADIAAKLIRPGEFKSPAPGLTIFAKEVQRGGRVVDLLIEDASEPDRPIVYMAKVGEFTSIQGEPALVMTEGSIQTREANGSLSYLKFDSYPFELSNFVDGPGDLFYKLSDRYLYQLLYADPDTSWDWSNREKLFAEGHYRLSAPLYNIAFALMALAAVLGGRYSRLGDTRRIITVCALAMFVRILGFVAQSASVDDTALNPLQYAVPIIAGGWALAVFLKRTRPARRRGDDAAPQLAGGGYASSGATA